MPLDEADFPQTVVKPEANGPEEVAVEADTLEAASASEVVGAPYSPEVEETSFAVVEGVPVGHPIGPCPYPYPVHVPYLSLVPVHVPSRTPSPDLSLGLDRCSSCYPDLGHDLDHGLAEETSLAFVWVDSPLCHHVGCRIRDYESVSLVVAAEAGVLVTSTALLDFYC